MTRIDNVLEKIDERLESARSQLAHTSEQLENARTEMVAPFPKEAELAEKTRRLNELNVLLNLNEPDRVVMSEEPDEGGKPHPENGRPGTMNCILRFYRSRRKRRQVSACCLLLFPQRQKLSPSLYIV